MYGYFRAFSVNQEMGGIDFHGKFATFVEAKQRGELIDFVSGDGVHYVFKDGTISSYPMKEAEI